MEMLPEVPPFLQTLCIYILQRNLENIREEQTRLDRQRNVQIKSKYNAISNLMRWPIFEVLKPEIPPQIHMVMIFGTENSTSAFIVTEDKTVYAIGDNSKGQLGIRMPDNRGHFLEGTTSLQLEKVELLCRLNIRTFYAIRSSVFAVTEDGEVYAWGDNSKRLLGLAAYAALKVRVPTLLIELNFKNIIDISCSIHFALAFTGDGRVYAWGRYGDNEGNETTAKYVPKQVKFGLEGIEVKSIACNDLHSIIVTSDGKTYNWDRLKMKIAGNLIHATPYLIKDIPENIVKVACGCQHTLALTSEGKVYSWGDNSFGQLGLGSCSKMPKRIADPFIIPEIKRMLDIAIVPWTNMSAAVCEDKHVYVWGQCHGLIITIPFDTKLLDLHAAFAKNNPSCMHKPLIVSASDLECICEEVESIEDLMMKYVGAVFNNPSTSNISMDIEENTLYLHSDVLRMRSLYFKSLTKSDWVRLDRGTILRGQTSYVVYRAFFKYLYTGVVDVPTNKLFDLIVLAHEYQAMDLVEDCIRIVKEKINLQNVLDFCRNT